MQCHEFDQILEQHLDGLLPETATAHLEGCEACRAVTADLSLIHAASRALGAEELAVPDRVWHSLRLQLEDEGIIREPSVVEVKHGWWLAFQRPAFAGAFLSVVLIAAGLIGYQSQLAPAPSLSAQLQRELPEANAASADFREQLQTVAAETVSGLPDLDPAVTASLRRNLDIIDNSIAVCEKSVREQPENEIAREYLYGAYQEKADLLATAMNHSTMGGLQ